MYNGIGLQTARGSGTNGHVQRNFAFVRAGKKDNTTYKTEEDLKKMDALNNRPPNQDILEHERKRKIEVKCIEFEEILEDQNYTAEEIAAKVQSFREKLLMQKKDDLPKDEFGRVAVRETHQVAAAQQEKNEKLRSAFGISEYFVDGSSFDVDRKGKEEVAKSTALQEELEAQRAAEKEKNKRYKLVRTPSREKEVEPTPDDKPSEKKKNKMKKKKEKETQSKDKKKSKKKKDEKSAKNGRRSDKRKRSKSTDSSSSSDSSDSEEEKKKKLKKKKSSKKGGDDKDSGKKSREHPTKSNGSRRRKHSPDDESSSSSDGSSSSSSSSDSSSSSSEPEKDRKRSKNKQSRKRKHANADDSSSSPDSSGSDRKQRRK